MALLTAFLLSISLFCTAAAPSGNRPEDASPWVKESTRGGFKVRTLVDKLSIPAAGMVVLRVEAEFPEEYRVQFPASEERAGGFHVLEWKIVPPRPVPPDRVLAAVKCTLEPEFSGELTIPPLALVFIPMKSIEDSSEGKIPFASEEVRVEVQSLLGPDREAELLPPFGPESFPKEDGGIFRPAVLGVAAIALSAGLSYTVVRRRRRAKRAARRTPAHEIALLRIQTFEEAGRIERDELKAFFGGLFEVVRSYLEYRFGLFAPSRTVPEFLAELDGDDRFSSEQKAFLANFLGCCDRVRFAGYLPCEKEIAEWLDGCRAFVRETAPREGECNDAGR